MKTLTIEYLEELSKTTNGFYSWDYVAGLAEELLDFKQSAERVLSETCPSDERHCGCVVYLRAEIERLRKVIDLRDDAIESYATLYDKASALCGFEDALPSAEMDEMILYAIKRGMEPKPTLIDALNEIRNKREK